MMQAMLAMLYPPDPREQVRKWQRVLRNEQRQIDREVRTLEREQQLVVQTVKGMVKTGDTANAREAAKTLVMSRKAIATLHANKAHLGSVMMHLSENLRLARVAGHLQKSTEVMAIMNGLVKAPQMMATMQAMSKEMMKAGILQEMVDDVMDDVTDSEGTEDVAEAAVDRILSELAVGGASALPSRPVSEPVWPAVPTQGAPGAEEMEMEERALQVRLDAIRAA
jgi:charged multivesicular body protein 3